MIDQIGRKPWNSWRFEEPKWFGRYPTMLTREEMRMLSWVAAHASEGAIVDLGCFLGGSSVSLAHGVRSSGRDRKVHSFDLFQINERGKSRYLYRRGLPHFEGSDALPVFGHLTREFHEYIVPHEGDIMQKHWTGGTISLLFVDVSKTIAINDHLLREFFTRLKPGSIIVQQDFLFMNTPWLFSTMMRLKSKTELVAHTEEHSAIFRVTDHVSAVDIEACLARNTTDVDMLEAIAHFEPYFPNYRQWEMLEAAKAAILDKPGNRLSWKYRNVTELPYKLPA